MVDFTKEEKEIIEICLIFAISNLEDIKEASECLSGVTEIQLQQLIEKVRE